VQSRHELNIRIAPYTSAKVQQGFRAGRASGRPDETIPWSVGNQDFALSGHKAAQVQGGSAQPESL